MTTTHSGRSLFFCVLAAACARAVWACGTDASGIGLGDDGGADAVADALSDAFAIDSDSGTDGAVADGGDAQDDALADGAFVADGGSASDAGPGGNTSTLPCGSAQCGIPAQTCCVFSNPNPPPDFFYGCYNGACPVDAGFDAGTGDITSLKCSGAANCPVGSVCCVYETANKRVASDCFASCGGGQAQLCDPSAVDSGCSPDAGACSSANVTDWGLPNTYATCGGVGN